MFTVHSKYFKLLIILHNRPALIIFGCKQYIMESMSCLLENEVDGTFAWKRGCMGIRELKQYLSRLSEDEIAQFLTTTESTTQSLSIP